MGRWGAIRNTCRYSPKLVERLSGSSQVLRANLLTIRRIMAA
jgi:hypothetical protein